MKNKYFYILIILSLFLNGSCAKKASRFINHTSEKQGIGSKGIVVTAHPLASAVGAEILEVGGNAIDAAIAVQFALTVVYPIAGNIGGGGFMVYKPANGEAIALDFREKAPIAARKDMYLDSLGNVVQNTSIDGSLAIGVPGTVDGIYEMYSKFSRLRKMSILVEPSIKLARRGFAITATEAQDLNEAKSTFLNVNDRAVEFTKEGDWKEGDILQQKKLAATFSNIVRGGRHVFYEGALGHQLCNQIQRHGGIITLEDLKTYKSVWRKPIEGTWKDYSYYSIPLPSSGGLIMRQVLGMIEDFPIAEWGQHDERTIHLITEAERRAFADRSKYMGDPDYIKDRTSELTSESYLKDRISNFSFEQATPIDSILPGVWESSKESDETTHFSIIDQWGNAVSITTTLNGAYGSKVVADGGYLLNNEMDDFSIKPGTPNSYGLIGSRANAIEPGKRMLSSMTPIIVTKDSVVHAIIGSPGGSTIPSTVLQVFLNFTSFSMSPFDCVQSYRYHHQWKPDQLVLEKNGFSDEMMKALKVKGYQIKIREELGKVEAIFRTKEGKYIGVADRRGDDDVEICK